MILEISRLCRVRTYPRDLQSAGKSEIYGCPDLSAEEEEEVSGRKFDGVRFERC